MSRYRTKPTVTVDAVRWLDQLRIDEVPVPDWVSEALAKPPQVQGAIFRWGDNLQVFTPDGLRIAKPGDYVIRSDEGEGEGELRVCRPDVFEATYEPAAKKKKG